VDANGERLALKGRYRRWLTPRAAVDASAGALYARRARAEPDFAGNVHVPGAGVTGDVTVGLTDWAGVSVRADLLFDEDGRSSALYGGLKLGPVPPWPRPPHPCSSPWPWPSWWAGPGNAVPPGSIADDDAPGGHRGRRGRRRPPCPAQQAAPGAVHCGYWQVSTKSQVCTPAHV
jgi:hypothetical protein